MPKLDRILKSTFTKQLLDEVLWYPASAKLTGLPLQIMRCGHDMITRYLECPWHDFCIIRSYDVTGADFENLLYAFGQSEKS